MLNGHSNVVSESDIRGVKVVQKHRRICIYYSNSLISLDHLNHPGGSLPCLGARLGAQGPDKLLKKSLHAISRSLHTPLGSCFEQNIVDIKLGSVVKASHVLKEK